MPHATPAAPSTVLAVRNPRCPTRKFAALRARFRPREPSAPRRKIERIWLLSTLTLSPESQNTAPRGERFPAALIHRSAPADNPRMDSTRRDVGAPLAGAPVARRAPGRRPRIVRSERDVKPRKKELRRCSARPAGSTPWERYRALNDAMDEAYELMDHSNREARFALLVMGILNAFVVISASRPEVVGSLDTDAAHGRRGAARHLRRDRDVLPVPGDRGAATPASSARSSRTWDARRRSADGRALLRRRHRPRRARPLARVARRPDRAAERGTRACSSTACA